MARSRVNWPISICCHLLRIIVRVLRRPWWRTVGGLADRSPVTSNATAPLQFLMHVVLVHPEIHWNTGNAGRTCLAVGAALHLIEPLGFSLDEKQVKRAGLDYWDSVDLHVWPDWPSFERVLPALGEPYFFSTRATRTLWDAPLGESSDVVLVFGRETGGLPDELHARYCERFVGMPMLSPHVRSLNLSTSIGIAAYEVLRQRRVARAGGAGGAGK
jgi:tRNA (cytidine/uridine-2'-O-)-methyltransferase